MEAEALQEAWLWLADGGGRAVVRAYGVPGARCRQLAAAYTGCWAFVPRPLGAV